MARPSVATHDPIPGRDDHRQHRRHLRVCANTDIFKRVLDYLPVSADLDRERYAAVGRALADPKRLCVLESLAIGELSVSDLSTRVGCQVPNMSQHLAVLRRAGLVTSRRDGNTILYRLADARVLEAYRLIQDIAR
jgi:DNA-binding transcriptional ArsR family regulator